MRNNEKLVEFIKADWEAKRVAFQILLTSPFSNIGFQQSYPTDQLFLPPMTPVSPTPQEPNERTEKQY
jgi:hypothetical protein